MPADRILRLPAVLHRLGVRETTLRRRIKAGDFPPPFKLGTDPKTRAVGWKESTVTEYLSKLGGAS